MHIRKFIFLLIAAGAICALPLAPDAIARAAPHHKTTKTTRKTAHKTTTRRAAAKPTAPDKSAQTEANLRDQTDSFVSLISAGQQDLTDAHIAWTAQRPVIACQHARSAQSQFNKAQATLDTMVKIAGDDQSDTAPLKALYPKTSELRARAEKLISLTCIGG